jgi:hypothetical protein
MPIVHQDKGFDFVIKAEDKEPPKVHITGAKGKYLLVRIGKPEEELPYIEKYEKVDHDEIDWVWEMIADYQENFLNAWKRIHSGEWKTGPEPVMMELKAKKDRIKEVLGGICDKRFLPLQKKLIWDLDKANFRSIDLGLYMRLGGWSHTGGTYLNTMNEVKALCEAMFGYALPEKIGKIYFKVYRYRTGESLVKVAPVIKAFHEGKIGK